MIKELKKFCGYNQNLHNPGLCWHPLIFYNSLGECSNFECSEGVCPFINFIDLLIKTDEPIVSFNNTKSKDYLLI